MAAVLRAVMQLQLHDYTAINCSVDCNFSVYISNNVRNLVSIIYPLSLFFSLSLYHQIIMLLGARKFCQSTIERFL